MTCEKAEGYLSAYLDDMLDPQLRQEIAAHLEGCAHCREVLAEYRRFDELLASAQRVAPPVELHDRIFHSPEVAALIRAQGGSTSVPLLDRPVATGDEDAPAIADPIRMRTRSSSPPWKRVALQSAAVLALLLGSALLIKQGLLHSTTTSGQRSVLTVGGPRDKAPLSAGNRAVYALDGALWSVPESGPELARQLTPSRVTVAGWAVSSDGRQIAYTDSQGGIHVIRSDDQSDHVIGRVSANPLPAGFWSTPAGAAVAQGLAWSPDGDNIAYVAVDATGRASLHVVRSDGAKDTAAGAAADNISSVLWSPNGAQVAYVATTGTSQTLVAYDVTSRQPRTVVAQADAGDSEATFADVRWMPGNAEPALTWAARDGGAITGVFSHVASAGGDANRLTQPGTRYTAAQFSAHGSGEWMLAEGGANPSLDVVVPGESGVASSTATQGGAIANVVWSPDGTTAAYLTHSGQLGIWAPGNTAVVIANGASLPVWSSDSSRLAFQVGTSVYSVRVVNGQSQVTSVLATSAGHIALAWAPDNSALAISSASGVVVASTDGTVKIADSHAADGTGIVWTIAR